eukprot:TRINITY_DN32950_c0_g1_i1.p1 TRINITY_DN32950_c0_g1~~TRINITY_DN32950_c0_g1_i1.p1  ORF type:complete len:191 (+),score=33.22 TRINITY_DN32950_c0_g1_i1:122-694(+)
MLQANKGNVITKFHKKSLDIRYKELKFFLGVFNRMSAIASLLAGFASSAMMLSVPRWENAEVVVAFLIFTGSAFGMNLLVILIATLCCLWAPGKALRGQNSDDLTQAITVLEGQQQTAMRFFIMGLFSYFISSIMVTCLFFDHFGAVVVTVLMISFLFHLVRQSLVIRRAFMTNQPFTSSQIRGNPMRAA